MDEQRWVRLAREGDPTAFEELVRRHRKTVYSLALARTGRHHDAEEISQTVFLNAWKALSRFRGEAAFGTWLHRLTVNACADWFRRRKEPGDVSLEGTDLPELPDPAPSPEEWALRREEQQALLDAIEALPEEQRSVLLLREWEGLRYQEIAQRLGVPEGTVRSRLARARKALAARWKEGDHV